MITEEFSLDGLYCKKWIADSERAVIQIIHGLGEMSEYYEQFAIQCMQSGITVYMCELRSHGRTTLPDDTEDVISDMISDCRILNGYISKSHSAPVFILGHSMGAVIAQLYIKEHGENISGLILTGCAFFKDIEQYAASIEKEIGIRGSAAPSKDTFMLMFGRVAEKFPEACTVSWVTSDLERALYYEKLPYTNKLYSCGFYKSFINAAAAVQSDDFVDELSQKPPVLIACGGMDSVGGFGKYPPLLATKYANAGFDTRLFVYENARHSVLQEVNRKEITADIVGFVKSLI